MPLKTSVLWGSFENVTWENQTAGEDQRPGSLIENGFGPVGERIYRNKTPIGNHGGKDIWLVHVRDIAELENCISNNSKILTWKQAKADKANGLMDFTDETVVELEYADGSKFEQRDTTLCVVAGGGAPDDLEFQGEREEADNPVVEIQKTDVGAIVKIKEKDK